MKPHSKFFRAMATCLFFSVATAVLGVTSGCGEAAPPSGEAVKAKIEESEAKVKEVHSKKRLP